MDKPAKPEDSKPAAEARKPFEALAQELAFPKWLVAALRAYRKLAVGQEMTVSELKAIKDELFSIRIGR